VALHDSENTLKTAFSMAPGPFGLHQLSKMGLTRTVLPYFLPALHRSWLGHRYPSCMAGHLYFKVPRDGSWPMNAIRCRTGRSLVLS